MKRSNKYFSKDDILKKEFGNNNQD